MTNIRRLARPRDFTLVAPADELFYAEVHVAEWSGPEGFIKRFRLWSLRPDLCDDAAAVEVLLEDLSQAARVSAGAVAQLLDVWRGAGRVMLATEHISGLTLAEVQARLEARGERLPLDVAVAIALELAHTLDQLHDPYGLAGHTVHGDLRPELVLLGYEGVIKVTGVGFSRFLPLVAPDGAWWRWSGRCYQPPERLHAGPPDPRADLFSLGTMLFDLVTGAHSFSAVDPQQRAARVQAGTGELSAELARVLKRSCAPRPQDRHPTAEALAADLHGLLMTLRPPASTSHFIRSALEVVSEPRPTEQEWVTRPLKVPHDVADVTKPLPVPCEVTDSTEPLPVPYEVTDVTKPDRPVRPPHPQALFDTLTASPLVGRDELLTAITQAIGETAGGRGRSLLLTGKPGAGRSRLLEETAAQLRLAAVKHAWLQVRGRPTEQGFLHAAVLRLLAAAMGLDADGPLNQVAAHADRLRSFGVGSETLATVRGLLGVGEVPEPARVAGLMRRAAYRCVSRLCWEQTTVVVWDDLQWIDEASLECLAGLVDRLPEMPVVTLLSAPKGLDLAWGRVEPEVVDVRPLTRSECAELATARTPGTRVVATRLLDELVAQTAGNPLMVEEVLELLLESDRARVELSTGELQLCGSETLPAVEDALHERLNHLGPEVSQVAVLAALHGPVASPEIIAAACEVPPGSVQAALEALVVHRVLRRGPLGQEFPHERLRRVVLELFSRGAVDELRRLSARALLAGDPDCGQADLAADLLLEAGERDHAAQTLADTARRQEARGDQRGATERYGRALELVRTAGGASEPGREELRLCMETGRSALHSLSLAVGQRALEHALELAAAAGDAGTGAEARVLLCRLLSRQARLDEALELARQALPLAKRAADPLILAQTYAALAESYQQRGEFGPDRQYVEGALLIAETENDLALVGAYLELAVMHAVGVGDYQRPKEDIARARAIARTTNDPLLTCRLMRHEALLLLFSGEPEPALRLNLEGVEQARRHGMAEMEIVMLHNAGDDHLFLDNMIEAHYYFSESMRRSRRLCFDRLTEANEMFVGFVVAARFRQPSGFALMQAAIDRSRDRGRLWNLTQGHQLRGRALLAIGAPTEAVEELREAVRIGEKSGIRFFTDQARLWLRRALDAA